MDSTRADFVAAHLHALAYAARKFAGEPVRFVDEVRAYFDVSIVKGDEQRYREAHALLDDALGGRGPLADRMHAYRTADEIAPERLSDCIRCFRRRCVGSSSLEPHVSLAGAGSPSARL